MNTSIKKAMNGFNQMAGNRKAFEQFMTSNSDVSGNVPIASAGVSTMATNQEISSHLTTGIAPAASVLSYDQESVLSILRDFPRVNYEIDFTSGTINYNQCRQVMKFLLAISIKEENQDDISEESVANALGVIDGMYYLMPSYLSMALAAPLNNFVSFVQKVSAANAPLHLIDALSRWAGSIWLKVNMAWGNIPCDFSEEHTTEGSKAVTKISLLFTMFGKSFSLKATISASNQVENLKLQVVSA